MLWIFNINGTNYYNKMNLKEARELGKTDQFIKELGEKYPPPNKKRLERVLKSMVSGTVKPKRGTSRKGSRGN